MIFILNSHEREALTSLPNVEDKEHFNPGIPPPSVFYSKKGHFYGVLGCVHCYDVFRVREIIKCLEVGRWTLMMFGPG